MAGRFWLGHPQLDALDFAAVRPDGCSAWDTPAPDVIRFSCPGRINLLGTKTVAMQDFPGNEPGDRLEAHVGMWSDAHCLVVAHLNRALVVQEAPRPDGPAGAPRQGTAHRQPGDVRDMARDEVNSPRRRHVGTLAFRRDVGFRDGPRHLKLGVPIR
jgi:hypothetical protein